MEIRKLNAMDYDELLSLLNTAFQRNDFDRLLPKMWQRDDDYMGRHIGLYEDGRLCAVVGTYPFYVHIGDKILKFATTGNVATHPEHEGKGYFTKLFELVLAKAEKEGFDALRLGGARQRYGRFGYEPCGSVYRFTITQANRKKCFLGSYEDIKVEELLESDVDGINFTYGLYKSHPFYVERYGKFKEADVFGTLGGKSSERFIAKRNGVPIGYICANNDLNNITEINADTIENYMGILCAWQKTVGKDLTVLVSPFMTEQFKALSACAQDMTITTPSLFKVMNFEKLCDALMKLSFTTRKMPVGEFYLTVENQGTLRFWVSETAAGCEKASQIQNCPVLSASKAQLLLFGPFPPSAYFGELGELNAWLPLPMSWHRLDAV